MNFNNYSDKCIGIVDSVSPSEIKGFLLDTAPTNVSITEGNISLFPRINSFLTIPNETGCLVGMISWIGYNHLNVNSEVNLPRGARIISLNILGHITATLNGLEFERGAFTLPTVGDPILLPDPEQMDTIIENHDEESITIGTSPLAGNRDVRISVNELFGRHLAVLGNTGSGKSCTVSGLIRWSIESSEKAGQKSPNARFIILDPNGEYKHSFDNLNVDVTHCTVKDLDKSSSSQLRIPAWMWTSSEWASVFQASDKTQKPLLREALRDLKAANQDCTKFSKETVTGDRIKIFIYKLECFLRESIVSQSHLSNERTKFGKELKARVETLRLEVLKLEETNDYKTDLINFCDTTDTTIQQYQGTYNGNLYYNIFPAQDVQIILSNTIGISGTFGKASENLTCNEDDPIEFPIENLAPYIAALANDTQVAQYIDFMTIRIKSILRNSVLSPVIGNNPQITLLDWVNLFLGESKEKKAKICIIDLSLLPSNIVHLMVSVIARLIFEALQRYRKHYEKELPTLLIMEEAHNFIKKYSDNNDNSSEKLCTQVFEKIAREGRKFGLGLVVSSQRPSELSPTVLSQCNSFILHRIVNDRDQDMVRRMVPDNMGNILSELPALPTKKAIILGSAVSIPTVVDIKDIPSQNRPKSDTPDFWKVWTHAEERSLDWKPIVDTWQG
ncbi:MULTISPECIES: ATP-binding protein [Clostridia]|jgi:hypothetical protein|uniref:AAA-like domain protein n=3 Tax=Clostridia TaxID=186801 RepID=A0A1V4IIX6_9CLOT|nr:MULTISPECIES: ATP-binding protein [Clostridia]AKA69053.1 hypothetical protein CSCA_1928 [Clostridium scatologenes]OPJ59951.1 AAA-like domain protein [Clostridium oryzae]TCS78278.1 hypothetical protein EDD59_11236 [Muricomes intestini]